MTDASWNASQAAVYGNIGPLLEEGRSAVLVTVVDVQGNAYRRPGAKMLIRDDRSDVGSVSAGCLEPRIEDVAEEVLASRQPTIETFDLTGDGDDVWGLGLGCDGIVTLLFEPLTAELEPATAAFDRGETVVAVTPVTQDASVGSRAYFDDSGRLIQASPALSDSLVDEMGDSVETFLASEQSGTVTLERGGERVEVFVDVVDARPHLIVFGSGHDVAPLTELGRQSGFRVTVVGFRGGRDLATSFQAAHDHVTMSARDVGDLELDDRTYAVVMTHNFVDDRIVLDALLDSPVPYVGLMGPRERFEEMREEHDGDGEPFTAAELDRLYTPIGLDLGGSEPYQIAVSIIAEVTAVHNDRNPVHLTDREGPIHARLESVD